MKHVLLVVLFSICTYAQGFAWQLKGKVSDLSGDAVPYANVYVENTTQGVVTNVKGEYFMDLPDGSYQLVFTSMGYQKTVLDVVIEGANKTLNVVLEAKGVILETVELREKKKDRAYEIMAQVIKNKRRYIKQFESFSCETYLKASLETDTIPKKRKRKTKNDSLEVELGDSIADAGADSLEIVEVDELEKASKDSLKKDKPNANALLGREEAEPRIRRRLNFIESHSTTHYQYPKSFKSVIHAFRDMADKGGGGTTVSFSSDGMEMGHQQHEYTNPYLFYLDVSDANFNFYKNLVPVLRLSDKPLVSPLSETAWRIAYKYKLEETFYEEGRVIYKIKVTPRNRFGPYFEGHLFIVDGMWAIKSVNLQVVPADLNYFNYFQVVHNYEMTENGRWLLMKEDYYYNVKDGRTRYYGNTIVVHKDYDLDFEHPKNFFRNEVRRFDNEAYEQDSTYWVANRPITLKAAELDFIHESDSMIKHYKSPAYLAERDSVYNRLSIWNVLLTGVGYRDRKRDMRWYINPLIAQIKPLSVGGYRHALGGSVQKTFKRGYALRVEGEVDYGFANNDIKGYVKLSYVYNPKRFGRGYVKYGDRYSMITTTTNIASIFSRSNYMRKTYYGLGHEFELVNGLMLDTEVEFSDRKAIDDIRLADWSNNLFGGLNDPTAFDPFREARIIVRMKYTPRQKYSMEPYRKILLGSKWPTFNLTYMKAIPGIWNSEINYDYIEVGMKDEFRPGTMGVSRYQLKAGSYLQKNNIQLTDWKYFRGSDSYLFANPLRAFQNLDSTFGTTNAFLQAFYLHDFSGSLINKIPLLRRTPLQITGGGGILYLRERDIFHAEVYGGLQMPFRIKQQRMKFGVYYVTSFSNFAGVLDSQIKFGLTWFNNWNNSWEY